MISKLTIHIIENVYVSDHVADDFVIILYCFKPEIEVNSSVPVTIFEHSFYNKAPPVGTTKFRKELTVN